MNVLIISECRKLSLQKTRRVVDLFVERIGRRTWCGNLTQNGLSSMKNLLKKTASRGTAVSCFWIKKDGSRELLWIVGRIYAFGRNGVVPTDTTKADGLLERNENRWKCMELVSGLTMFAGLFHDLGKSSKWFQNKLRGRKATKNRADILRHEVISFLLFQEILVSKNIGSDTELVAYFSSDDVKKIEVDTLFCSVKSRILGEKTLSVDVGKIVNTSLFDRTCRAFARGNSENNVILLLSYLILTHHRLPWTKCRNDKDYIYNFKQFVAYFKGVKNSAYFVNDSSSDKLKDEVELKEILDCSSLVKKNLTFFKMDLFCKQLDKAVRSITRGLASYNLNLNHTKEELQAGEIDDALVLMLSRCILMIADHHVSSLSDSSEGEVVSTNTKILLAKSCGNFEEIELTRHCLLVAKTAYLLSRSFVYFRNALPRVIVNREIRKKSINKRFRWQDNAMCQTEMMSQQISELGYFGINIASTGTGKTLANTKIMFAASGDEGARFCFASGLRTLTLQSGKAIRDRLRLDDDDIAVILGDCLQGRKQSADDESNTYDGKDDWNDESDIWDENLYVDYDGQILDVLQKFIDGRSKRVNQIISAPVLVCTIDTLVNCFENSKGGKQIPAVLRLLNSDLIIDEIDDFGLGDLPAIARLVYFAGMFGSKVLLSSATMPRNLVTHLFSAFSAGRKLFNKANGITRNNVVLGMYDEFSTTVECCALSSLENQNAGIETKDVENFQSDMLKCLLDKFYNKRISNLKVALDKEHRTVYKLVSVLQNNEHVDKLTEKAAVKLYANVIQDEIYACHKRNNFELSECPNIKRISVGVVRFANINPLVKVAIETVSRDNKENYAVYSVVYHSRFPYLTRSYIEEQLDELLNNRNDANWSNLPIVKDAVKRSGSAENIIIVVWASPVEEVGRDHDFDWAIIEPSSIRSIIQMSGRVRRHRVGSSAQVNVSILDRNFKSLVSDSDSPIYIRPGFQEKWVQYKKLGVSNCLQNMALSFGSNQGQFISSIPRILDFDDMYSCNRLASMEYSALEGVFYDKQRSKEFYINADNAHDASVYWRGIGCLAYDEQSKTKFRESIQQQSYVRVCDEFENIYMSSPENPERSLNSNFLLLSDWCQKNQIDSKCLVSNMLLKIDECGIIRRCSQKYDVENIILTTRYNKFEVMASNSKQKVQLYFNEFFGVWNEQQ